VVEPVEDLDGSVRGRRHQPEAGVTVAAGPHSSRQPGVRAFFAQHTEDHLPAALLCAESRIGRDCRYSRKATLSFASDGTAAVRSFREHFTLDAAGNIDIKGKIVKSSGKLEGSHGRAHWTGTANADGSGNGTYSGRWHEGRKPPHKQQHHS
jgi:hypothetical protein